MNSMSLTVDIQFCYAIYIIYTSISISGHWIRSRPPARIRKMTGTRVPRALIPLSQGVGRRDRQILWNEGDASAPAPPRPGRARDTKQRDQRKRGRRDAIMSGIYPEVQLGMRESVMPSDTRGAIAQTEPTSILTRIFAASTFPTLW
jgi:hypothetical protein